MKSLRQITFYKTLSIEDLTYLNKLLNTNLSLSECFELLKNKRNDKIFKEIRKKLDEGELIENIIESYLPKQVKAYVSSLLNSLSFTNALSLSLHFYEKNEEDKNGLLNTIAYPLILLFITITSLYLFDLYGMDSIFSLTKSFNADFSFFQNLRMIFRVIINIFYYAVMIGTLFVIYFMQPKRITMLYILISKYFPNSLFNIYYCMEFMSFLLICHKSGYKTKQSLEILKAMKSKPLISFLAFHLDDSLLEGESLKEATKKSYYDSALSRFIKIATYTNDFQNIISSYIDLAQAKMKMRMKTYSLTIQIFTYVFIGAIIIFIYQILFMPMQAISTF